MADYARPLIAIEDVKGILKKDTLETLDENLLKTIIIPGVCAGVETYLNRKIFLTEVTEYYDGPGTDTIKLRQYPIVAESVEVMLLNGSTYAEANYNSALTEDQDFIVNYEAGLLEAGAGSFLKGRRLYQVTYSCGYAIDDVPQDIKLAVNLWCAILAEKIGDRLFGVQTHQIGDAITTYFNEGVPTEVASLLARHRRGPYG